MRERRSAAAGAQYRFERHLFWRNPSAAFFNFLLPLIFLALFGAIVSGNRHELDIIVPGIAGMSVMSTTFTALAYNLTFLREQGVLKRMRGTPLPSGVYLGGLALNAVTNAAIQIGDRGARRSARSSASAGRRSRSSWSFSRSPAWSASPRSAWRFRMRSRTSSRAPAVVNAVFVPVILISGVFFDVKHVPSFLRDIAQALPLDHLINGLSGGLVHGRAACSHDLAGAVWALGSRRRRARDRGFSWEARRG